MWIDNLEIQNVRCFDELVMNLSVPGDDHDGINLVIGPNMGGKTTILDAIFWALFGVSLNELPEGNPRLPVQAPQIWKRASKTSAWNSTVLFRAGGRHYAAGIAGRLAPFPTFETFEAPGLVARYMDVGAPPPTDEEDPPLLVHYPPRCHLNATLSHVPVAFDIEGDWTSFTPYNEALSDKKLGTTIPLYSRYRQMAVQSGDSIERKPRSELPFDDSVFQRQLEEFLDASLGGDGFISRDDRPGYFWIEPGARVHGTPVHSPSLSDGFVSAFGIAIDLFIRLVKMPRGLDSPVCVIIDELSVFLHPTWQLKFLPMLRSLFPNAQFIVATHSPFVVASVPTVKLFTIERSRNESVVVDRTESAQRWTMEQILEPFGVSMRAPLFDELEREFENIADRISAGRAVQGDGERLRVLTEVLAAADPAFAVLVHAPHEPERLRDILRRIREES